LSEEELADRAQVSVLSVRRWEAGQRPQPLHLRRLCQALEAAPEELGFPVEQPAPLKTIGLDPDDLPEVEEIQGATLRLRRSYSTTLPAELQRRTEDRLRQLR